ncbi:MAG: 16S rRNA (uracil(1498)-N(3))-methyltransferase [Candidatus Kapaibacteriales bacterium]
MECLYISEIGPESIGSSGLFLSKEDAKHIKALRLKVGDNILATNGKGFVAECKIIKADKSATVLQLISENQTYSRPNKKQIDFFVSPLSDSSRFEFLIEKAVELGVNKINFLKLDNSEFKNIREERLKSKAIAALKQNRGAFLPEINKPKEINLYDLTYYDHLIVGSYNGKNAIDIASRIKDSIKLAILVGPEGGLSEAEEEFLNSIGNLLEVVLSPRRLRSETAAIALLSIFSG